MKVEKNWRSKTLETLEKDVWLQNNADDRLVKRIQSLRKIPLNEFSIEDLRVMIGQGFSLDYVVPLAFEVLSKDLLAEGDLYEGDLLDSVLKIPGQFWEDNQDYWMLLNGLVAKKAENGTFHSMEKLKAEVAK